MLDDLLKGITPEKIKLISNIKTFFEDKGLEFNKTEIEKIGKSRYLRVTVSIKLD